VQLIREDKKEPLMLEIQLLQITKLQASRLEKKWPRKLVISL
jgi:hypothetical protein